MAMLAALAISESQPLSQVVPQRSKIQEVSEETADEVLLACCQSPLAHEANRAMDQLIRRYQRRVYGLAFRFLHREEDALDVTQTTFVRVFQRLSSYRGEGKFTSWLFQVTVNLCKNYQRDEGRHHRKRYHESKNEDAEPIMSRLEANPQGPRVDETIEVSEEQAQLRAAIETLSPVQRSVMILRVYEEMPFKEIADVLETTEGAAKVNFHHALTRLRERMGGAS